MVAEIMNLTFPVTTIGHKLKTQAAFVFDFLALKVILFSWKRTNRFVAFGVPRWSVFDLKQIGRPLQISHDGGARIV